jgi:hypothetical protein
MKKLVKFLLYFWIVFFGGISLMGITRHVYLDGHTVNGKSKDIVTFLASLPSNIYHFKDLNKCQFLVKNEFNLKNGFTYNRKNIPNDYILISVWDNNLNQSIVKLISTKSGKTIYKWNIPLDQIIIEYNKSFTLNRKKEFSKNSTRIYHPFLNNDGSIIFGAGGLYKVDKYSNYIWKKTKLRRHHSIERENEKIFWTCGDNNSKKNELKFDLSDDCIYKIDANNGKIILKKSIFEILIENNINIGELLTNTGAEVVNKGKIDYFHINDIEPVLSDSKFWKKGDLFISLRNRNMIFLYRPCENKIIWKQSGPWLKQHDVDIINSNQIGIFGNDVIDGNFSLKKNFFINKTNHHYIFDFEEQTIKTPFNQLFKNQKIQTIFEGRSKIITNKGIFIEETCGGRLIFGDEKGLIWTYVEKIDEEHLSMFSWSRYITEEEFSKFTFLKNK